MHWGTHIDLQRITTCVELESRGFGMVHDWTDKVMLRMKEELQ